jgi:hypothetical protein
MRVRKRRKSTPAASLSKNPHLFLAAIAVAVAASLIILWHITRKPLREMPADLGQAQTETSVLCALGRHQDLFHRL